MSRSLKKGPFADESLLKKVDAANASGDKTVIKTLVLGRVIGLRPAFLCGIIIKLYNYNNARRDFETI